MAMKSTLFLIALVLLTTRMASSSQEIDDIETEASIYALEEALADAFASVPTTDSLKARIKPPFRRPPTKFPPKPPVNRPPRIQPAPKFPWLKPPKFVMPPVHLPPVRFPPFHLPGVPAPPETPVNSPPTEGDYPSNPTTQDTETLNARKIYEVNNEINIHHYIRDEDEAEAEAETDQTMRFLNVAAAVQAPAKSPVGSPPKRGAYPPIPSSQDCMQMCEPHCPKKPKRPCMKNCLVCCRDNHCVPEVSPKCKWEKAMFNGKKIKCT